MVFAAVGLSCEDNVVVFNTWLSVLSRVWRRHTLHGCSPHCGWRFLVQRADSLWYGPFPTLIKISCLLLSAFIMCSSYTGRASVVGSWFIVCDCFLPCKQVFWLPWWHNGHPESAWPLESSAWTKPSVSGPARPGAPYPVPAAADRSESASGRTLRSGCTREPTLWGDREGKVCSIDMKWRSVNCIMLMAIFAFYHGVHYSNSGWSKQIMRQEGFRWISLLVFHCNAHTHTHTT